MKTKRVLIVTDSLGAPRSTPETVIYEDSWVFKAKKHFEARGFDVFAITDNGLHSGGMKELAKTKLALYSPDIAIFQYGIVDCAPRVLREREILLAKILGVHKIVRYIAGKYHAPLSKWRNISLFTTKRFEENTKFVYDTLRASCPSCLIVHIPVAPACKGYIEKSPRIAQQIEAFNAILGKYADIFLSSFFEAASARGDGVFMNDFHHINKSGHDLLFESLRAALESRKIDAA